MSNEHVRRNRSSWNHDADDYQSRHDGQLATSPKAWGVWSIPESTLGVLGDLAGRRVLELGCGGGQWTAALRAEGVDVTGIDLSEQQLAHAARREPRLRLTQANAEELPFPDATFDVVFCDHGATTFTDPYVTVPEVARVLRDGGTFAFSITSPWLVACWPPDEEQPSRALRREYFGMHQVDDGEFQIPYGEWVRLFRANGLVIDDLIELRAPDDATTSYGWDAQWARNWPAENVWRLTRTRA